MCAPWCVCSYNKVYSRVESGRHNIFRGEGRGQNENKASTFLALSCQLVLHMLGALYAPSFYVRSGLYDILHRWRAMPICWSQPNSSPSSGTKMKLFSAISLLLAAHCAATQHSSCNPTYFSGTFDQRFRTCKRGIAMENAVERLYYTYLVCHGE